MYFVKKNIWRHCSESSNYGIIGFRLRRISIFLEFILKYNQLPIGQKCMGKMNFKKHNDLMMQGSFLKFHIKQLWGEGGEC